MPKTTRIDKYLAQLGLISRREAKKVFRAGRILLNGYIEKDHGTSVIDGDEIMIDDLVIIVKDTVTILLHKPAGYVCSEIDDGGHASYKHLLEDCIYAPMIHVAGRLDYDTSGLVVATSDGTLNHQIISPKSHRDKEYIVICKNIVSDTDLIQLQQGVRLEDDYLTLPSRTNRVDDYTFHLIIIEGKYHQIKRMCEALGNECVSLHRIRVGEWTLDGLASGEWRYI